MGQRAQALLPVNVSKIIVLSLDVSKNLIEQSCFRYKIVAQKNTPLLRILARKRNTQKQKKDDMLKVQREKIDELKQRERFEKERLQNVNLNCSTCSILPVVDTRNRGRNGDGK